MMMGSTFLVNIAIGKFTLDSKLILLEAFPKERVISLKVDVYRSLARVSFLMRLMYIIYVLISHKMFLSIRSIYFVIA
jgi:hypothetical protein